MRLTATVTAGRLSTQGVGTAAWMPLHVGSDGTLILDAASRDQEACLLQGDIKVQVTQQWAVGGWCSRLQASDLQQPGTALQRLRLLPC